MADVEFQLENGVLWIRLNRPEQMNAMTAAMRDEIIERLSSARADAATRAVVLTGTGKGFCTGADLSRPAGAPAPTEPPPIGATREVMRTGSQRLLRAIWEIEKPVVAAVNGTAAGLGAHLAFASDLILAAESARFIEVFVRRGIAIDAAGGFLVPRVMPLCKAKELVFFGDSLSAGEALAMGLVNRVVPDGELEALAREWADRLAQGPTFAIGVSKRLLNRGTEVGLEASLEEEAYAQTIVSNSDDAKEGLASFREKRKPAFRGR
ncbi:MAG TPA: enoyl-CoA hydratase-related protein [Burkholderiales bacterium]|nr:enoyl-CoA hydratase-related protein [Burkholderiales bacterium]